MGLLWIGKPRSKVIVPKGNAFSLPAKNDSMSTNHSTAQRIGGNFCTRPFLGYNDTDRFDREDARVGSIR